MGIDVGIAIKVREGGDLPSNYGIVEGDFEYLSQQDDDWRSDELPFANAELSSMTRYYGVGYERGPWPDIAALLLQLLINPDIEGVWYYGDHTSAHEQYHFVTVDTINKMNRHYVSVGHEPYRGRVY